MWSSDGASQSLHHAAVYSFHSPLGAAIAPIRAWLRNQDRPTEVPTVMRTVLLLALLNSSVSFFLFSFQVHEKTILLPLLPMTLLLSAAPHESSTFRLGVLANKFSFSLRVPRWFIWDALCFTCWSLHIDHRHDIPTYSPCLTSL